MSDIPKPFEPDWVIRPGVFLKEELAERGIPSRMLQKPCDLYQRQVEGLFTGETEITERIAVGIGQLFGTSATLWLNLEKAYRKGLEAGKKDVSND